MTAMKPISEERRKAILFEISLAQSAMGRNDEATTFYALDKALKIFNGWDDSVRSTVRYDQLHDACEAFLKETRFPSLSVASIYIDDYRKLARIGRAVLDATCDMTHYWRCESWNTEDGKRRSSDPHPSDETCTCGLKDIVAAINAAGASTEE